MHTFRKCIGQTGTHVIELDLHLTKDGDLVIMHNSTVNATTDGTGHVREKTIEELRKLDAAYHYTADEGKTFPLRGQGHTVPTLREFLDEFIPFKDLVFFFDLKHTDAVQPLMKVIEKEELQDRVILGAVSTEVNRYLRKHKPPDVPVAVDIKTMLVVCVLYNLGLLPLFPLRHDIYGFFIDDRTDKYLGRGIFDYLSRMGKTTAVFGPRLDEPNIMKKYLDLGADLILTDRPDVLWSVWPSPRKEKGE